jgi:hypothetical protein
MNKIITIGCFCLLFGVLFFIIGTQTSCQKQNTNCTCVITVLDSAANPVNGVTVRLYAPHAQNGATGYTNIAGKVDFTFNLPAIFNVAATKALGQNDTLKGSGIIQLQIGQTESTTIRVLR